MNKWFAPQMPPQDVVQLRRQLALIIGYNQTTGKLEALGDWAYRIRAASLGSGVRSKCWARRPGRVW